MSLITSALGTLLVFPAFRLRGHTIAIATLAIGEVVSLVILNWESLTRGAMGVTGIPPLSLFGHEIYAAREVYWLCLAVLNNASPSCRHGCCRRISAAPSARFATTTWPPAPAFAWIAIRL